MEQKKLKKSTLMKSYLNWSFFHLTSLGFERMEAFGFLHSMLPVSYTHLDVYKRQADM